MKKYLNKKFAKLALSVVVVVLVGLGVAFPQKYVDLANAIIAILPDESAEVVPAVDAGAPMVEAADAGL